MSKRKIFLSLFLILCLTASMALLAGCGDGDDDDAEGGAAEEEQQEGDNGNNGDDSDDAADDSDDSNDDADDEDTDDDSDDDADDDDDNTTINNLLGKTADIDGIQWEMTMTNYEEVEVVHTSEDWIEGNKWRSEFETLITKEPKVTIYDYDEGFWYDWLVGGDEVNKYALSGSPEEIWGSQADENITDYTPTIVGTETVDGKTCTVIEYTTDTNQECKVWIWNEYGVTLKIEVREAGQLTMKMEWTDVVVGDIDDSMFELPAGMTIVDMTTTVVL